MVKHAKENIWLPAMTLNIAVKNKMNSTQSPLWIITSTNQVEKQRRFKEWKEKRQRDRVGEKRKIKHVDVDKWAIKKKLMLAQVSFFVVRSNTHELWFSDSWHWNIWVFEFSTCQVDTQCQLTDNIESNCEETWIDLGICWFTVSYLCS